jgi:hypothetical protein
VPTIFDIVDQGYSAFYIVEFLGPGRFQFTTSFFRFFSCTACLFVLYVARRKVSRAITSVVKERGNFIGTEAGQPRLGNCFGAELQAASGIIQWRRAGRRPVTSLERPYFAGFVP